MSTMYTPDGVAVNTAPPSQYIQATASIAVAASATAECTYQYRARANVTVAAAVTSSITYEYRGLADVHAKAQFGSLAQGITRTTTGSARASTSGKVVAFVYRFVSAFSSILATGGVLAIPADAIGESDVSVSCTVSAEAIRIQLPKSHTAFATANIAASAALGCPANPTGTATLYAETGINGVYEAFTDNTQSCTATVAVNPYTFTNFTQIPPASIDINAFCTSSAAAIRTQRPTTEVASVGLTLIADALLVTSPGFGITVSASMVADATRLVVPVASFSTSATVVSNANQKFLASSTMLASAAIDANLNTIFFEEVSISTSAFAQGAGVIIKVGEANIASTASTPAVDGDQLHQAEAQSLAISSVVTVNENVRLAEQGVANIRAKSTIAILGANVRLAEQGQSFAQSTALIDIFDYPYINVTRYVEADISVVCTVPIDDAQVRLAEQGVADIAFPSATVTPEALRVLQPVADVSTPAATLDPFATNTQQGVANISVVCTVPIDDAQVRLAEQGVANISVVCTVPIDDAQVRLAEQGESNISVVCTVPIDGAQVRLAEQGESDISVVCTVPIDGAQVRLAEQGVANVNATLTLTPVPTRTTFTTIDYTATASVAMGDFSFVYIVRFGESDIVAAATIIADSVANADSLDPPERTFIRPPENTTFVRPAQEFTFRKVA